MRRSGTIGGLVWLTLAVTVPRAARGADAPSSAPVSWGHREPAKVLIPAVETVLAEVIIFLGNRYAFHQDASEDVSGSTIKTNLKTPPHLDGDNIFVNYLGHPYMGALPFEAARSTGLSFWQAVPFTVAADLGWEYFGEAQNPSTNDLIETGIAGPMWGEAFHRITTLIFASERRSRFLALPVAITSDPPGSLNYALFGVPEAPPAIGWSAGLYAGGLALSAAPRRVQGLVGVDMSYGFPDTPRCGSIRPFDIFTLRGDVGVGGAITIDAALHGLVAGGWIDSEAVPGAWGLVGLSDFLTGPGFRVASTGLGAGILAAWHPVAGLQVRTTLIGAGDPIVASGSLAQTDSSSPVGQPGKYSMGPGLQDVVELELLLREVVAIRATERSWWVSAFEPANGGEHVDAVTLGATVLLPWHQLVGVEGTWERRLPAQPADVRQSGWLARLFWGFRLGG